MTAQLDKLLNELKQLSLEELLTLQERIIEEMRSKTHPQTETAPPVVDKTRPLLEGLKMLNMDHWPPDSTYRREDIYDDRGL